MGKKPRARPLGSYSGPRNAPKSWIFEAKLSALNGLLKNFFQGTNYDVRYPYLIMALIAFTGATSSLFLPETLGQRLPETIHEARVFGKGQKFWSLPAKPKPEPTTELNSRRTGPEKAKDEKLNKAEYAP